MPRIQEDPKELDDENWSQFGDGGVRHTTPVTGYFQPCDFKPLNLESVLELEGQAGKRSVPCGIYPDLPPHEDVQQLFLLLASPYSAISDKLPPPECCPSAGKRRHVSDGRDVLSRTLGAV